LILKQDPHEKFAAATWRDKEVEAYLPIVKQDYIALVANDENDDFERKRAASGWIKCKKAHRLDGLRC
jgi:hypothetical protein